MCAPFNLQNDFCSLSILKIVYCILLLLGENLFYLSSFALYDLARKNINSLFMHNLSSCLQSMLDKIMAQLRQS